MPYFTPPYFLNAETGRGPSLPMPVVFENVGPQRYEYHTVSVDPREDEPLDESALQALGKDGWLLAGLLQHPIGSPSARIFYYFVRPAAS
jgi:hypothetical protein